MTKCKRWKFLITILVCAGITPPICGQEVFEVDERVPTGDCPGCIGVPRVGVITAVEDIIVNGSASPSILFPGGLVDDDAQLFLDRDSHFAGDVPVQLEGADYVASSQNNADDVVTNGGEIDIAIDVIEGGVVYVFIDTPEINNNGGSVPFEWMENPEEWDGNVFFDTGSSFWSPGANGGDDVPEAGDRQFYIYGVGPLDGGTYHIREQDVDSTYLGIAALFGGDPNAVFPPSAIGERGETGTIGIGGSLDNAVFTEPGESRVPGLGQSWYAVGNPGDKEGVDAIANNNDRIVPYFHAEDGTWWTGSADIRDVQKYPADFDGLLPTDNFLAEGYDEYTVKLEGEILIEESGTVQFLDGVDDYAYFAVDLDRSGVAGDVEEEVLINDDNWTDVLARENDDDGPPEIVEVEFENVADGGEWFAMEFYAAEGEGGDAGVLYWDATDEEEVFPLDQGDGLFEEDVVLLLVPDTHLQGPETPATLVSGEVNGKVPSRRDGWEVDVNPADGTSDAFVLTNPGAVRDEIDAENITTILDADGTQLHINALGEVSEGDTFRVFDADQVTGNVTIATEGWSFDAATGSVVFGELAASTCESIAATRLAGDADGNGEVAFLDFLALANNFGGDGGYEGGDFDCNGEVSFLDFLTLANNFGKTAATEASAVPEPSSLMLLGTCLVGLVVRRRRS